MKPSVEMKNVTINRKRVRLFRVGWASIAIPYWCLAVVFVLEAHGRPVFYLGAVIVVILSLIHI